MDSSNNNPFYHIRIHRPPTYDISFNLWCRTVSEQYLLAREGGGYDKVKHAFVRPHVHLYLRSDLIHRKLREAFKTAFPNIANNKDYSIKKQKKKSLLSYVLKGDNVVFQYGFDPLYLAAFPKWEPPAKHFQNELIGHIRKMKLIAETPKCGSLYMPYGYEHFIVDSVLFFREKDRWLPKQVLLRLAFKEHIISTAHFLQLSGYFTKIDLNKHNNYTIK